MACLPVEIRASQTKMDSNQVEMKPIQEMLAEIKPTKQKFWPGWKSIQKLISIKLKKK
jgi:hypothetical protein